MTLLKNTLIVLVLLLAAVSNSFARHQDLNSRVGDLSVVINNKLAGWAEIGFQQVNDENDLALAEQEMLNLNADIDQGVFTKKYTKVYLLGCNPAVCHTDENIESGSLGGNEYNSYGQQRGRNKGDDSSGAGSLIDIDKK